MSLPLDSNFSPKNSFTDLTSQNSPLPPKTRGRRISKMIHPPIQDIYPKSPPSPPLAKLKLSREAHPSETNKVIKKDLAVELKNERIHFGNEEAKTLATLDLSIDHQTMQFAYLVNELTDLNLSEANLNRFMKALDSNSVKLLQEMEIDPEILKKANKLKKEGPLEPPEYLDANGKRDFEKQKEIDRIFYGMVHAATVRGKSYYCKSRGLDFIKSGTARANEGGQATTPSVLINARYQSFSSKYSHSEVLRLGSFYDINDPGNTVKELENFLQDPSPLNLNREIYQREKEIDSLKEDLTLKLNQKERANKIIAIKQSLVPLYDLKKFKEEFDPAAGLSVTRKIEEKKRTIDDQMVQLILFQVSQNLDSLEGDTFILSFEGLLNELKTKKNHVIDSSGLIMDEGNNLLEMQGAFERFRGKQLIFDRTGPYLDREGNVHLPYELKEPKIMTLEPIIFNLTVNGSTDNNPLQAKLNQEAILQLTAKINSIKENHPELNNELRNIQKKIDKVGIELHQGHSNFKMASDLLAAQFSLRNLMKQHHLGCFATAVSCYSGKDRTAIVLELAIIKYGIDPELNKIQDKEKKKQLREKLLQLIIDPNGMSAEITFENTGLRVIKYLEVFLPGQQKTISSLAKATLYKVDQAKVLLNPPILE